MKAPSPPEKRRMPRFFLLILIISAGAMLVFQHMSLKKEANISFSHQVEHLVNLDLLKAEMSHKVAQNENLVTFSGQFRDSLTEEGKKRFRYLSLLNTQYQEHDKREEVDEQINRLKNAVVASSEFFLALTGQEIPPTGYLLFDRGTQSDFIRIMEKKGFDSPSLREIEEQITASKSQPSKESLSQLSGDLLLLVEGFRSQKLGIANIKMKEELQEISRKFVGEELSLSLVEETLLRLKVIVSALNREQNGVRLFQLRSTKSYLMMDDERIALNKQEEKTHQSLLAARLAVANSTWFFHNKELGNKGLEKEPEEAFSLWFSQAKKEWDNFGYNRGLSFEAPDQPRNLVLENTFKSEEPPTNYLSYIFFTMLPIFLVILLLYFVFARQMKGLGSNAMSFGKSPAKQLNQDTRKVTFADVAGIEEAKEELNEIIDFLKEPNKFTALGAKIPKGVLLVGPPGTGKTLIAKAVAGEAARPFFSISGSDFVEMFVGVGASRIRDLFAQAKKAAPCIVFMDEIDAVGRHRGVGVGGGHDEREQTLNQLLVEMDGFETNEGVILMAATNRPDVLDRALLRPGRFDRQVILDLPDIKGRLEILKVHARQVKLSSDIELINVARATPGSSGADLMNILNESALLAARNGHKKVSMQDLLIATDKVRYGKERRSLEIDDIEKKNTAYHESGHAIAGLAVDHSDPVEKVTIIPRGMSLGATYFVPEKNRTNYWRKELTDRLAVLMGGRAAEERFVGDISSGAQMDISQATQLARSMICQWGMNENLGPVFYEVQKEEKQYGMSEQRHYSDSTAQQIDKELFEILEAAGKKAAEIMEREAEKVEIMTQALIDFETLDKKDVLSIWQGTWDPEKKRQEVMDVDSKSPSESPSERGSSTSFSVTDFPLREPS
ncbi:MAG: ATP-dependent zinc metalloprotease FtsH [Chlamydiota bacterium]|nr:ATP-dependent zinc metalloprotease FtsH [Chlamydiota bacterium]